MEEILNKEIAEKLIETKGEVRGLALKSHAEFILREKGEEGLNKLENTMVELGCPIKYRNLKLMKFYPIGLEVIILLAIQKLFDFGKENFKEMGVFHSKTSLIMKFFMKYFVSIKLMAKEASNIWERYYTVGKLKIAELNEEEKYTVVRIRDFNTHSLICQVLEGYLSNVVRMVTKSPVTCEETKCPFRGDDYHEFLLKWK